MAQYRKKPVVIEAIQFTESPECVGPLLDFTDGSGAAFMTDAEGYFMRIPTLEGDMRANPGDWIIKGVNGEFYPCKPDIFEKTYEPVEGPAEGLTGPVPPVDEYTSKHGHPDCHWSEC